MASELEYSHTSEAIRARLALGARVNCLRDWIYGAIDGGVTTFAIVTGVVGANLPATVVFGACVAGTGAIFFCVGALKSRWSSAAWWCSGFETLIIGMMSAALAFAIGYGLRVFLHISAG